MPQIITQIPITCKNTNNGIDYEASGFFHSTLGVYYVFSEAAVEYFEGTLVAVWNFGWHHRVVAHLQQNVRAGRSYRQRICAQVL